MQAVLDFSVYACGVVFRRGRRYVAPSRQFAQFLDQVGGSSATVFAGRPFHFPYESNPLKCLFMADLPSMIATMPLALAGDVLVKVLRVGRFAGS